MKYALITGASRGIGRSVALLLAERYSIIINYQSNVEAAQAVKQEIETKGGHVELLPFDVSDPKAIEAAIDTWEASHPDEFISVLVNNAGIPGDMEVASYESELKDVIDTVQVNYVGTFCLTKALTPLLSANKGRIVNITVPSEVSPYWHPMAYVASKAAQNAMTSIMAMEFEKNNIPVEIFNIHPGATTTDLNNHYTGPGSHSIDVVSEKIAEVINDGEKHQGEFVELYPIVDEGR